MKITAVEAIPVAVPVRRPLKMAVATVNERTCIVVRVTTDTGVTGLGESVLARYFTGESHASAVDLIAEVFAPALVGRDPTDVVAARRLMRRITVNNPGARAAVEMALLDVTARAAGVPLYVWYGGRSRESVPAVWHVSGGDPVAMAEDAGAAAADGYPLVKVKVGGDVDADLAAVAAVRDAVGPDVRLLLDANQGWDVDAAIRFARRVEDARPTFIEQPVPRHDLIGMAAVNRVSPVLIAGDESVFDAAELRLALELHAVGAVVAKLMKAAGPLGVQEVFAVAAAAGIGVHFAGMAGQTSISAAHAAHLALAVSELRYGSGISPQYLADDVVAEPFLPVHGHLHPSDAPGIGIELDPDQVARYRTDA
jgi:L-alanine-DL-glutamate epimerase-like enolase superfamily enzyme